MTEGYWSYMIARKFLVLAIAASSLINCAGASAECIGSDPACNLLATYVTFQPQYHAVGSSTTECFRFDNALGPLGRFSRTGALTSDACAYLRDVATNGSIHVAIGSANSNLECGIYTSTDRKTWTQRTCPSPVMFKSLESIAYGNGLFVAGSIGSSAPLVRTSTDGLTWAAPATAPASGLNGMTFANHTFYAVFGSGVVASADPSTITFADQGVGAGNFQGLAIAANAAGVVVAAGQDTSNNAAAYVLQNGTWTAADNLFANRPGKEVPREMMHDGTRWIIVGGAGIGGLATQTCFIDYSYDGLNWHGGYVPSTQCSANSTDRFGALDIAYDGIYYYFSGANSETSLQGFILQTSSIESQVWSVQSTGASAVSKFVF